jgi:HTH-type transcriptional regulator / antitoxin HigA
MTETINTFTPNWVSPPGDTIADLLEENDWTQAQLSERMGYTTKFISQMINGKVSITEETALKLERVLGSTAGFWLTREAQYRSHLCRIEEQDRLQSWISWLDELPVVELMKNGVLPNHRLDAKHKPALVQALLRFFGVASPDDWRFYYAGMEVAFRRTHTEQSDVGAIASWMRLGELQAERLDCPKFNKSKFAKAVQEIRALTVLSPQDIEPKLKKLCWESGVVLALVPSLPRAHVSGLARWLNPHKALIQLSLYGKTNDSFWFTFFHEAAHILLHDKQNIFLDECGGDNTQSSDQEREADQWSRAFLIASSHEAELASLRSRASVIAFAEILKIHPGIVVGRLQYDQLLEPNCMNDLKEKFCFESEGVGALPSC